MKHIPIRDLTIDELINFNSKRIQYESIEICWPWIASTKPKGYGKFSIERISYRASRVAYKIYYGIDPGELDVLHTCDNPNCCNPHHLYLGTSADNQKDCRDRNRHPNVRLTLAIANQIRSDYQRGISNKELASKYNLLDSHISNIIYNRKWRNS